MGAENSTLQNATSCNANSCKNPLGSRQHDTVKIDLDKVMESAAGKENADPGQVKETAYQKLQRAEQERLAEEEEERSRYEEQLERRRKEAEKAKQRAEEERNRREEEKALRKQKEEEEEEERVRQQNEMRRRQVEEKERRRLEEQRRRHAEEERQRALEEMERQRRLQEEEEARALDEEARRQQEQARRTKLLRSFLEKTGFQAPNEKKVKKSMMSSSFSYPLHAAVEAKDPEAVELLLWAGADPSVENSKNQTPLQFAQKKNSKQGSHAKVIAALAA